jgi:hypothetical protein
VIEHFSYSQKGAFVLFKKTEGFFNVTAYERNEVLAVAFSIPSTAVDQL